ncbi:MAG: TIR domain-containing protein [Planctomycetota bacterium]
MSNAKGSRERLSGSAARLAAEPLLAVIGTGKDGQRLEQLLALSSGPTVPLSTALQTLFPDKWEQGEIKQAQQALTNLKGRLNGLAEEEGLSFRLQVDSKTRSKPQQRACWFEGENQDQAVGERFSDQVTRDIQNTAIVNAKAVATNSEAMADGKRQIRFFVSYAHDESGRPPTPDQQLLQELRSQFKASKHYALDLWTDHRIDVGDDWHAQIQNAIAACDFGLLLISPDFLGSEYIAQQELPAFVPDPAVDRSSDMKPVIPVGLQKVNFDKQDLKGLKRHQIFLLDRKRFFVELRGRAQKQDFAHQLWLQIENRLDQWFAETSAPVLYGDARRPGDIAAEDPFTEGQFPDELTPAPTPHWEPTKGHRFQTKDTERIKQLEFSPSDAKDALGELEAWVRDPKGSPFFAVLGEYGIGKTTTLKQFTRELLAKRKQDPNGPLPIYVDLREYVSNDARGNEHVPTIEELLDTVIQRSWRLQDRSITADVILRLVRERGAVILFDGLDEKVVHMTSDRAKAFIRTLWSVLPSAGQIESRDPNHRRGKILISCRSHYFRDVGSQNAMLTGEDREGIDRDAFPALLLLPFTREQILSYLTSFLGCSDRAAEAMATMDSIHNLSDLAPRPYLLQQITRHLDELELLQLQGETVNAARLYQLFVASWLNRDDGKHQIEAAHKRELMEELAAELWRTGNKTWSADRLERWLDRFLLDHPEIRSAYENRNRSVLKEDLRTATFVVRPEDKQNEFRFAHTSLQEFFLASYLVRALHEGKPECWRLSTPSKETLDFIGQLLQLDCPDKAEATLNALPGDEDASAALVAFEYWIRAIKVYADDPNERPPVPKPKRVNLENADLSGRTIGGNSSQPLILPQANLRNAQLNRARLEHVVMQHADLRGLQARDALFRNVNAQGALCHDVDFSGARWRDGSLAEAHFIGGENKTKLPGCQFLHTDLASARLPDHWQQSASSIGKAQMPAHIDRDSAEGLLSIGHGDGVWSGAFSAAGDQLLSVSSDNTLKLWNVASGACLRTFEGHKSVVRSGVFSPSGDQLLSASSDKTLKLWDVASGACMRTFKGHKSVVRSGVFSPSGDQLLSASSDNTLKLWDVASGACMRTFEGHDG